MTAQQLYDSLDRKGRRDLLLKVGETREEAQVFSQRDEIQIGRETVARSKAILASGARGSREAGSSAKSASASVVPWLRFDGYARG